MRQRNLERQRRRGRAAGLRRQAEMLEGFFPDGFGETSAQQAYGAEQRGRAKDFRDRAARLDRMGEPAGWSRSRLWGLAAVFSGLALVYFFLILPAL